MTSLNKRFPKKNIEIWFEDEARLGQQSTSTKVWAKKGTRPKAPRQTEYKNLYVATAVCPRSGQAEGMILPFLNSQGVEILLKQVGQSLPASSHALLILDRASYHTSKTLKVPSNIHLLFLPPYSPELNPVENLWHYLRSHFWSNRIYRGYKELEKVAIASWRKVCLQEKRMKSLCAVSYA
ncbi:IS630 family transposase [Neochlamydia sp. AcF84]|uniref:IS630 family transposase n=1 Tax=Neochlamydia sp. AcF84 TaxID=2315858 RepID=UPI00325AEBA2